MSTPVVLYSSLLLLFLIAPPSATSVNSDGTLLLSFKDAILNDPLSILSNWNYYDATPCSWNGIICTGFPDDHDLTSNYTTNTTTTTSSRVISLFLPNSQLLGSLPSDLFLLPHLRHLDLSANLLNGSLPSSDLFNATSSSELKILSLANNEISGHLPDLSSLSALQLLNLSDNALVGSIPTTLALLPNLTTLSLRNNYISGRLPGGDFGHLRFLDLSSNLLNGTIPSDFGVSSAQYLNLSYNKLSGEIPSNVGAKIPPDATVDLSFNNLTGGIPQSAALLAQNSAAFAGNPDLCGKPLKNLCTIPSTLSDPPNATTTAESPPAFAAIPKTTTTGNSSSGAADSGRQEGSSSAAGGGFKPATIAAIVIGDLGGIGLLFVAFLYVYHVMKKKREKRDQKQQVVESSKGYSHSGLIMSCCLRKKGEETEEESTETGGSSSDTEAEEGEQRLPAADHGQTKLQGSRKQQGAATTSTLVTVDGDVQLEMETLLKASAYILGAAGTTIVYKAVLADGTALAVRRIGESSAIDKLRDFEAQVRGIAKFRHPNLLRILGFYWGPDEKLLIHDYAPNGSLANITFSKKLAGSSPFHLGWEARMRIARGVARGLAYIHEKKAVHGNIKPGNILLSADMEARIGDFGLDRLLFGTDMMSGSKSGTSARLFGSKRSVQSQGSSLPELSPVPGGTTSPLGSNSVAVAASVPYQAPESLKNIKSNAKWDVYSFGMLFLELISGRLFSEEELCQWNAGFIVEERNRIVRMTDPQLRGEVEGKEEALLSCFKLGFACASNVPQRRPSMKDVVILLDRIPSSSTFY